MTGLNLLTYSPLLHNIINSNGVMSCQTLQYFMYGRVTMCYSFTYRVRLQLFEQRHWLSSRGVIRKNDLETRIQKNKAKVSINLIILG